MATIQKSVCSCGKCGTSKDHVCPKCGVEVGKHDSWFSPAEVGIVEGQYHFSCLKLLKADWGNHNWPQK
jgi:hypothetical protein